MTKKVLIVEDEGIVALDLGVRLEKLGYNVVGISSSGEAALQEAENHLPDLVLMDIRLSGELDGIETAHQLRERFEIPVVYLTAYADAQSLERAKVTQPYGYLLKPFQERELHSTIEVALYKIDAEKRTKAHASQLERVMASVPHGIALLDTQHRVKLANTLAVNYLNRLAGVGVGEQVKYLLDIPLESLTIEMVAQDKDSVQVEATDTNNQIFEVKISRALGHEIALSENGAEWILLIRDVTQDREIRNRIALQDRLAAIGQFAAGMAHDFNNMLASIIIIPEVIKRIEPNLSSPTIERLDSVIQTARRASDLINQLLDFSRANDAEMKPYILQPLLKEHGKMLERLLPKSIHLHINYPESDCTILCEPTRIVQALMNLSINARDAMHNEGVLQIDLAETTTAEARSVGLSPLHEWLALRVKDNGSGIPEGAIQHIYEPFFTTKAKGEGTGLGLAQVYGIVQQHGGHIFVDSKIENGTTFTLYFPMLNASNAGDAEGAGEQANAIDGEQKTILLVEDNETLRQSIHDVLYLNNYRVIVASHGGEALSILDETRLPISLVLSDLDMPSMGGLELCHELKRRNRAMQVMILSGYVPTDVLAELKALNVARLEKPIETNQLLTAVNDVLMNV